MKILSIEDFFNFFQQNSQNTLILFRFPNIIMVIILKGDLLMRKGTYDSNSNGYKIIVVDDESGILDSLSIFLRI